MKRLGIVGGIGPESTIEYYRTILKTSQELRPGQPNPSIIISSVDLGIILRLIGAGELAEVTDYLLTELQRLAAAGVDFALIAANAPHIVFDELARRSPIPLLSICEAACAAAQKMKLKRLGLFGARFTMQGSFYPGVFARADIDLVTPSAREMSYIHDKYLNELVYGIVLPETRDSLVAIARTMKERERVDGILLGGTELSLIFREPLPAEIIFLDTTKIHAAAAVNKMLE